jgi:hypothetical protein
LILDLAELIVKWPQFVDRLALPTSEGITTLEALAVAAADNTEWATAVRTYSLTATAGNLLSVPGASTLASAPAPESPPAHSQMVAGRAEGSPLEGLRTFLERATESVTLIAKLI